MFCNQRNAWPSRDLGADAMIKTESLRVIARISLNGTQKIVKGARRFIRRLMASSSSFRANSVKVDASTFGDLESALVHGAGVDCRHPHAIRAQFGRSFASSFESARTTKLYGERAADPKSRA